MIKKLALTTLICIQAFAVDLSFKDTLLSGTLKLMVSAYLSSNGFGKIENLQLDTNKKSLTATTLLEGEDKPLYLNIGRYEIVTEKSQPDTSCPCKKTEAREVSYLVLKNMATNRAWLNNMNKKFFEQIKIPISDDKLFIFKTVL